MANEFMKVGTPIRAPYHYTECGLDDVYLLNGYHIEPTPYGEGVAVEDEDELLHKIAISLIQRKPLLNGKQIRFLRKRLELTQAEIASLLRNDPQTVARWEKGESQISGPADALIRVMYLLASNEEIPQDFLQAISNIDAGAELSLNFEETPEGWQLKAA